MTKDIRQRLIELVFRNGTTLHEDRQNCEALLRNLNPKCRRETFVLVAALKEGVVRDLLMPSNGIPDSVVFSILVKRLRDNVGLMEEGATWAVEAWAEALRVGPYKPRRPGRLTNSLGMEFIQILDGEFDMGSPTDDTTAKDNEKPLHRVRITKPFYLGACPITQSQYRHVMGKNPSWFSPTGAGKFGVEVSDTETFPVEMVSWHDAETFCRKLSELTEERFACRAYRLPSELEWEYACRAGTTSRYFFGDNPADLSDYAWSKSNSERRPHPVGQKKRNPKGLYDMLGNVSEWCLDPYDTEFYRHSPINDPVANEASSHRVIRGGGWYHDASVCRCASRSSLAAMQCNRTTGFRVVCIF